MANTGDGFMRPDNRYCSVCGGFHPSTTGGCITNYPDGRLAFAGNDTKVAPLDTGEIHRAPLLAKIAELEAALTTALQQRQAAQPLVEELKWSCREVLAHLFGGMPAKGVYVRMEQALAALDQTEATPVDAPTAKETT